MDIATALYAPNANGTPRTYGPFSLNGLTDATTDRIEWTMALAEDYPADNAQRVFTIRVDYSDGLGSAEWGYNGGITNRDGERVLNIRGSIPVFRTDGRKNRVTGARCSLTVYAPFTATITVNAIDVA